MSNAVLIALRFVEYAGATILFGSSRLLLFGHLVPPTAASGDFAWSRRLLLSGALALLLATIIGFVAQTTTLAGSLALALKPETLKAALWQMDFGISSLVRGVLAVLAICAVLLLPAGPRLWWICMALGVAICASFAWMGHGAATQGNIGLLHLVSDIAHTLAAAGWIGALVVIGVVVLPFSSSAVTPQRLGAALTSFSGVGTILVAIIVATGVVNGLFLLGWDIPHAITIPYGQVLLAKLLIFLLMVWLAAMNRYRHVPALEAALREGLSSSTALRDLRRSVLTETAAGMIVLVLVAWLGMLAPVVDL